MPGENVVTNLIVTGGESFVRTLTGAADAQDKLTNSIKNASTAKPPTINQSILNLAENFVKADTAGEKFVKNLTIQLSALGLEEDDAIAMAERLTQTISKQSKALLENAKAAEQAAIAQREFAAKQAANFAANLRDVPIGRQTGFNANLQPETRDFGRVTNLPVLAQAGAITKNIEQQRTQFLETQVKVREQIEQRALQAQKLRAENRAKIEQEANQRILSSEEQRARRTEQIRASEHEKTRLATLATAKLTDQGSRQTEADRLFAKSHPEFNAKTATTLNVATETDKSAKAVKDLGNGFDQTGAKGITYLSNLSAIHAMSFLLTGRTFTLFGSLSTLGLAFSQLAPAGTRASLAFGTLGIGLGAILGILHLFGSGISTVINITEAAVGKFLQLGAAATLAASAVVAAAIKLASTSEDVLAQIAAFGEPTKKQFADIEDGISNVARKFGQSAASVGEGASLFIRAGGDINDNINESVAAVTRLTIASSKELIPATAARAIVTITNAFKSFNVTADQAVDVLVGVAQKSALSFSEVTQAFQQAAPTAALLKIPLLDLAATIGVLANQGLRGQVAGTGFKQFLLDLLRPSEQAKAKLEQLGISIQDASGKIRPLRDIFADLKVALGEEADALDKSGDASKAQALALIFGSRANLAAAIIARTGAEAFDKLKDSIAGVSAEEVVGILLSTTSAQVNILRTNVEELARAFGGPLNVAIGTALKSVNEFLQGISRGPFQAAAQGIIAVFAGGGFGAIKEQLDSIADTRVREFFVRLAEAALDVRNAVVNNLIPAFQQAGSNISAALGTVNITATFQGMTSAIVGVIQAGSRLIVFVSELVSDFITGNQRGQEIKRTLENIADVVKGALTAAFTAVIVPIVAGIAAIALLGQGLRKLVETAGKIESAMANLKTKQIEQQFTDLANTVKSANIELSSIAARLDAIGNRRAALQVRTDFDTLPIQLELDNLNKEEAALKNRQNLLKQSNEQTERARQALVQSSIGVIEAPGIVQQLQNDINSIRFASLDDFLSGDLPDSLTAIFNKLKEIQDAAANRGTPDRETEPGFMPDPKKAADIARQITDITRQNTQDLLDLQEDTKTKQIDLERKTADRILDIITKLHRDEERLDEDTKRKLKESDRQFNERRSDRNEDQAISRRFELEGFLREQANAKRDQLTARQDAAEDRQNQQRLQDNESVLARIENREQRSIDIKQSMADRAFQRLQQQQDTAFSRQQSREEQAFNRQQQNAATARENTLRLAAAKTPQERNDIQKQIQDAAASTRFSRQQEEQALSFRIGQENKAIKFKQGQEDVAFSQSVKNEQAIFDARVAFEKKYLAIRRQLETEELIRQATVDDFRLARRTGLARLEFDFRNEQSDKLQAAQDEVADRRQERTKAEIIKDAEARRLELRQTASENIFGAIDDAQRQRIQNEEQAQKQLRDINQRGQRALIQLAEREPTAASPAQKALIGLEIELVTTRTLLQQNTLEAERFFRVLRDATLTGEGLPTTVERRNATFTVPELSPEAQRAINQAQAVNVGPILQQILPPTVAAAISAAQQQQGTRTVTIDATKFNNNQIYDILQNLLFNRR